jgi:limonene-1,2-epoxide hydrolase
MNQNEQLIEEFYSAFSEGNFKTMESCYHAEIQFQDPAFGILKGKEVIDMWEMLIERSKDNLKINFFDVKSKGNAGSAKWIATYVFSKTNRTVENEIFANFEFQDGLIIRHIDYFNLWNWSKQALGTKGLILGWTGFMQRKIQQNSKEALVKFQQKKAKITFD